MNNQQSTGIQPFTIVNTNVITGFSVKVTNVVLFTSANLLVTLFDASGNMVSTKFMTLSGTDYTNWASDDTYINNYVAAQLGTSLS